MLVAGLFADPVEGGEASARSSRAQRASVDAVQRRFERVRLYGLGWSPLFRDASRLAKESPQREESVAILAEVCAGWVRANRMTLPGEIGRPPDLPSPQDSRLKEKVVGGARLDPAFATLAEAWYPPEPPSPTPGPGERTTLVVNVLKVALGGVYDNLALYAEEHQRDMETVSLDTEIVAVHPGGRSTLFRRPAEGWRGRWTVEVEGTGIFAVTVRATPETPPTDDLRFPMAVEKAGTSVSVHLPETWPRGMTFVPKSSGDGGESSFFVDIRPRGAGVLARVQEAERGHRPARRTQLHEFRRAAFGPEGEGVPRDGPYQASDRLPPHGCAGIFGPEPEWLLGTSQVVGGPRPDGGWALEAFAADLGRAYPYRLLLPLGD